MASPSLPASASAAPSERIVAGRIWRAGLLAALAAVVGNVVMYAVAKAAFGVPPEFAPLSMVGPTIFFTVFGVLAATLVFALVARVAKRPVRAFTIAALVALAVTVIPDFFVDRLTPGTTAGGVIALILMHIVAAAASIGFLTTIPRAAR